MGLHHFPNPYWAISELCRIASNYVVLVDIMNPLITKILTFFGLFKKEWCGIEPKRLEERKIRLILNPQNVNITTIYLFNPPYRSYGDSSLCAAIKLLASVINFIMSRLANKVLGLIFGNVAIILVKFEKESNYGEAS